MTIFCSSCALPLLSSSLSPYLTPSAFPALTHVAYDLSAAAEAEQ